MDIEARATGVNLAGPRAFSWRLWALAVPGAQLILSLSPTFGTPPESLLAAAYTLPSGLVFLAAGYLVPRVARSPRARLLTVLAAYLSSSAVASFGVDFFMASRGQAALDFQQIASGVIAYMWFLCLGSSVTNDRHGFAHDVRRLTAIGGQIAAMASWRASTLNPTRSSVLDRIQQQIEPAKLRLSTIAKDKQASEISIDALRPFLHELDQITVQLEAAENEIVQPVNVRRGIRRVFAQVAGGDTRVALPAGLFTATTWLLTGFGMGRALDGLLWAGLAGGLEFGMTWAVARLLARVLGKTGLRLALAIVVWVVGSAVAGLPALLLAGIPTFALAPMGIQTAIVVLVLAVGVGYRSLGQNIRLELEVQNSQLKRLLVENATHLKVMRDRVHFYIHGAMQSNFLMVECKLDAAASLEAEDANQVVADIYEHLDQFKQMLKWEAPLDLIEVIRELEVIWDGVIGLQINLSKPALAAIPRSPVTTTVLSQMLVELVNNAVKHSNAKKVSIQLDIDPQDPKVVTVECLAAAETGSSPSPLPPSGKPEGGNGTKMFNEVCLAWNMTQARSQTRFAATVPLVLGQIGASDD